MTETMMIKMTQTQEELFNSALESLPDFVMEMDVDWDDAWEMVCDFIESQCGDLPDDAWDKVEEVYLNSRQLKWFI
jgi:hypothetical protein